MEEIVGTSRRKDGYSEKGGGKSEVVVVERARCRREKEGR